MRKKLFAIPFVFGMALAVCGCAAKETTSTTEDLNNTYRIKVYDIDDELIGDEVISLKEYPKFVDGLNAKFDVEGSGTFITSINKSIKDSKYYLSIIENGNYAETGVDGLVADAGDVFEFKNVCWDTVESGYGSLDSYDVLVDKVIYHYAKNGLKTTLASTDTFTGSTYWEAMAINLMKNYNYDSNLFNANLFSKEYKESIVNQNVSSFEKENDYFKWYYAARLMDVNTNSFKEAFGNYLEGITTYEAWKEYSYCFALSIAKELELDSKINAEVKNPSYRSDSSWGTDGLAWELTGLALYNDLADSELEPFVKENINKGSAKDVSLANVILPYIAMNKNPRDKVIDGEKDIIEYLFDTYFDKETYQFNVEKAENDTSSNQIYACLMAYKAYRDQKDKKAVILFA